MQDLKKYLNKKTKNMYILHIPSVLTFFRNIDLEKERKVFQYILNTKSTPSPTIINLPKILQDLKENKLSKKTFTNMYENILRLFDNDEENLFTFLNIINKNKGNIIEGDYIYNSYILLLNLYFSLIGNNRFLFQDKLQINVLVRKYLNDFSFLVDLADFIDQQIQYNISNNVTKLDINKFKPQNKNLKSSSIGNYYSFLFIENNKDKKAFEFSTLEQIENKLKTSKEFINLVKKNLGGSFILEDQKKAENKQNISKSTNVGIDLGDIKQINLIEKDKQIDILQKYKKLDEQTLVKLYDSEKIFLQAIGTKKQIDVRLELEDNDGNIIISYDNKQEKIEFSNVDIYKTGIIRFFLGDEKLIKQVKNKLLYPINTIGEDTIKKHLKLLILPELILQLFDTSYINNIHNKKYDTINFNNLSKEISSYIKEQVDISLNYLEKQKIEINDLKDINVRYLLEYNGLLTLNKQDNYKDKDVKNLDDFLNILKGFKANFITLRYLEDNILKSDTIHNKFIVFRYKNNKFVKKENKMTIKDKLEVEYNPKVIKSVIESLLNEVERYYINKALPFDKNTKQKYEKTIKQIIESIGKDIKTMIMEEKLENINKKELDKFLKDSFDKDNIRKDTILQDVLEKRIKLLEELFYNSIYLVKDYGDFISDVEDKLKNINTTIIGFLANSNRYFYYKNEDNFFLYVSNIVSSNYKSRLASYIQGTLMTNMDRLKAVVLYLDEIYSRKFINTKNLKLYKSFRDEYKKDYLILSDLGNKLAVLKRKGKIEYRIYIVKKYNQDRINKILNKIQGNKIKNYNEILLNLSEIIKNKDSLKIDILNFKLLEKTKKASN